MAVTRRNLRFRARHLWIGWTSGKDSAWILREARSDPRWEVRGLLAVVNAPDDRAEVHGVRRELLKRQAAAVDLPLSLIEYDWRGSSKDYERSFGRALVRLREEGAEAIAFSDLSALRHRERSSMLLGAAGLEPVFPLWGRDPRGHCSEMLREGLSAWVCSVATDALAAEFVGRRFDADFLADLPDHVDPGGEGDEFHTFVEWAPGWKERVAVEPVRTIDRYGYAIAELSVLSTRRGALATPFSSSPGAGTPFGRTAEGAASAKAAEYSVFRDIERLKRVRRYVDDRFAEDLRIDDVAAVASMSSSGFGRYFRRHVGLTFGAWLTQFRVTRACELLRDPDHSVRFVARAVGLGTDRNLRRVFQQVMGCSPSEYRSRHHRRRGGRRRSAGRRHG